MTCSTLLSRGDFRWRVDPVAAVGAYEFLWSAFPSIESLRGARVLKSNQLRTVVHIPSASFPAPSSAHSGGAGAFPSGVVAKVYRYPGVWDRLRSAFLPHRAEREGRALERLSSLGIPVPRCLGFAEHRERGVLRGGGLVVEFLEGSESLNRRLRSLARSAAQDRTAVAPEDDEDDAVPAPGPAALSVVARAGKLVRLLHDRGVWHRDLNAGNLLCSQGGDVLHVIDVHSCVFLPAMNRWFRRRDIAQLGRSIFPVVGVDGFRELLAAYGIEALYPGEDREGARARAERHVRRLERVRVRSRSKRCWVSSTRFEATASWGLRLYHLRHRSAAELAPLWRPDPARSELRQEPNGWVTTVPSRERPMRVTCRRLTFPEALAARFVSHRLRRLYACAHGLWVRGIPTPGVVALREVTRLGLVREAYLVTEAFPLDALLEEALSRSPGAVAPLDPSGAARRLLVRDVARLLRRLHDLGLDFGPVVGPQIVVHAAAPGAPSGEPSCRGAWGSLGSGLQVVEPEYRARRRALSAAARARDLIRLAGDAGARLGRTDLLRGLHAYARGEPRWLEPETVRRLWQSVLDRRASASQALGRGRMSPVDR